MGKLQGPRKRDCAEDVEVGSHSMLLFCVQILSQFFTLVNREVIRCGKLVIWVLFSYHNALLLSRS